MLMPPVPANETSMRDKTIAVGDVAAEHALTGNTLAKQGALQLQRLGAEIGQLSSAQTIEVVARQRSNVRK